MSISFVQGPTFLHKELLCAGKPQVLPLEFEPWSEGRKVVLRQGPQSTSINHHIDNCSRKSYQQNRSRLTERLLQCSPVSWLSGGTVQGRSDQLETSRTTGNTTLIPRGLRADIWMDLNRKQKQKQSNPYSTIAPSNNTAAMENRSAVNQAIKAGNQRLLREMLDNNSQLIKSHDGDGFTPLSYAAYHGYVAMVDFFLQNYPSLIDVPNKDRSYPIHKACQGGHIEVLNKMYSHAPISFTLADKYGRTILHIAAKEPRNKLKDVVSYLLNLNNREISKSLIVMKDENLKTPLQLAQDCKNYEVAAIITQRIR